MATDCDRRGGGGGGSGVLRKRKRGAWKPRALLDCVEQKVDEEK